MSTTQHASFVIERVYPQSPARVFAAWARPEVKVRWFFCHDDWELLEHTLDFRAGGHERLRVGPRGGTVHAMDAHYHDVVADRRIVYGYAMALDDVRISVSLATIELTPEGSGTRLTFTEQVVFLDGHGDLADREEGTRIGLENLAAYLSSPQSRSLPEAPPS
jgi:uncharacterized protein YndB with AHSA1/START domain